MTDVLTEPVAQFLRDNPVGVLGVSRADGSIHQSLVYHLVVDGTIVISTEPTRVKGRAIARTGWASYSVRGNDKPYPSISLEGPAVLRQDEGIGALTTQLFTLIFGTEPETALTDDQVRAMNRAIVQITPERVYAVSYLQP